MNRHWPDIRAAVRNILDATLPTDQRRPGDDLPAAYARRIGVPVLKRAEPDEDTPRVVPNRRDKRAARSGDRLEFYRGGNYTPRTSPRAYRGENAGVRAATIRNTSRRLDSLEAAIAAHPAGKGRAA